MTVTVLGGLDKFKKEYKKVCIQNGFKPKFIFKNSPNLWEILENSDVIILITSNINHNTAKLAKIVAKEKGIPLFFCHKSSISSFKNTIEFCTDFCKDCVCKNSCSLYLYQKGGKKYEN